MKQIEDSLSNFKKEFSQFSPLNDQIINDLYMDIVEVYEDFLFDKNNLPDNALSKPRASRKTSFNCLYIMLNQIGESSMEKDVDSIITGLVNVETKLNHSRDHLNSAIKNINILVSKLSKD